MCTGIHPTSRHDKSTGNTYNQTLKLPGKVEAKQRSVKDKYPLGDMMFVLVLVSCYGMWGNYGFPIHSVYGFTTFFCDACLAVFARLLSALVSQHGASRSGVSMMDRTSKSVNLLTRRDRKAHLLSSLKQTAPLSVYPTPSMPFRCVMLQVIYMLARYRPSSGSKGLVTRRVDSLGDTGPLGNLWRRNVWLAWILACCLVMHQGGKVVHTVNALAIPLLVTGEDGVLVLGQHLGLGGHLSPPALHRLDSLSLFGEGVLNGVDNAVHGPQAAALPELLELGHAPWDLPVFIASWLVFLLEHFGAVQKKWLTREDLRRGGL